MGRRMNQAPLPTPDLGDDAPDVTRGQKHIASGSQRLRDLRDRQIRSRQVFDGIPGHHHVDGLRLYGGPSEISAVNVETKTVPRIHPRPGGDIKSSEAIPRAGVRQEKAVRASYLGQIAT